MIIFIIAFIIVLYLALILCMLLNMKSLDSSRKALYIVIGILVMLGITFIVCRISTSSISFPDAKALENAKTLITFLFAPINGLLVLPYFVSTINKKEENLIDHVQTQKRFLFLAIFFILCLFVETGYIHDFLNGSIAMINK